MNKVIFLLYSFRLANFWMIRSPKEKNITSVSDDKGPLLASYYALLALKKKGLIGNYQVRLLVGGNEESGSLGVHFDKDRGLWVAQIMFQRKAHILGRFKIKNVAVKARLAGEEHYFGKYR